MKRISSLLILLAFAAQPSFAVTDAGVVVVDGLKGIAVRVSADTNDLNSLAQSAFNSHGCYKVVATGQVYDIRFSRVSATQEHVSVSKAGSEILSETVTGTDARNALLRAADVAVEKTNGVGLRGFFASKLAFIGGGTGQKEVHTGDLFFGDVRRITSDHAIVLSARWSPDGAKLVYTSFYHSGFPDIFLLDLAANQRSVFESFRGTNTGARFSPDGRQVAMVLSGTGTPEIYTSDAQGHGLSRRTHVDEAKSSPCWSPDGSRIVYACEPGPQLYVMSASGGASTQVTHGIGTYCAEPDWSRANPDKIAFTIRVGGNFQIAVLDLKTGKSERVSKASFDAVEPCWLPDGRHLVYTARNATESRISILDTMTGSSRPVSPASFGPAEKADVLPKR